MIEHIYYGPWVNWSHGPVLGSTLTLGDRSGSLLTAFIAMFVTLVGAQLFKILIYIFHQARSRETAQDGLYHQQQVIFRNTGSPGTAAWSFLVQGWAWNGKAKMTLIRTLPWAFFCLFYLCLFGVAAVFSAEITKAAGSARLVVGDTCGYWDTEGTTININSIKAYSQRIANTSLVAAAYARSCYGGSNDGLSCTKYTKSSLTSTKDINASCPFERGMCRMGDKAAYKVSSQMIDSLHDLGINSREADRLYFQKVATCAPITVKGYVQTQAGGDASGVGINGDGIYQYMYGPSVLAGASVNVTDYTLQYNNHTTLDAVGYKLSSSNQLAGWNVTALGGWDIIPELQRKDADVTVLFLSANAITYSEPVDDPMFSAHISSDLSMVLAGATYYSADNYVTVMGCIDQYQICNPENNQCTSLVGINQVLPSITLNNARLALNTVQQAIAIRMMRTAQDSSINGVAFAMAENGLRAKEVVVGQLSQGLPNNQWQVEVDNWFNKGLADIQIKIVEYATGPTNVVPGSYVYQPWKTENDSLSLVAEAMCYSQMINDTTDTVSFSVLGMTILFVIGGMILVISLCLETVVGCIQRRFGIGNHARMCWLLDDKLQLHRFLNQELGHGEWTQDYDTMPSTVDNEQFNTLAYAQKRTMTGEKKAYSKPIYQSVASHSTSSYPRYSQGTAEETFLPK